MLMGRKTKEFAQRMGGRPPLKGVTTYVFSRTLESVGEGATLVKEDAAEFVRRMKGEAGGPSSSLATSNILVMGGGEIGSALLEAGLVDEVGFSIHPVLLGVACLHSSHSPTASDLS
jgi:dihydrofolate reductase